MPVRVKPKSKPKTKAAPKPQPKLQPKPAAKSVTPAPPPPVTATVLQGVDGIWAVDVAISHGDLTVVRINGRAVWLGTPQMQLVLLQDMVSSYAATWGRVANTEGIERIQIGDCFKEQGTYEELRVAGIDISPVGGASRLYFERCANATQPQTHRIGAVLEPTATAEPELVAVTAVTSAAISVTNQPLNGLSELEDFPAPQNLVGVKPGKAAANALRQKRFRERRKLENSQHS